MNQAISNQSTSDVNQPSTTNSRLQSHFDRAEIIGRYGEALKKFDWLINIIAAFALFTISLLATHYIGALPAGVCATMGTAALILLKKKTG